MSNSYIQRLPGPDSPDSLSDVDGDSPVFITSYLEESEPLISHGPKSDIGGNEASRECQGQARPKMHIRFRPQPCPGKTSADIIDEGELMRYGDQRSRFSIYGSPSACPKTQGLVFDPSNTSSTDHQKTLLRRSSSSSHLESVSRFHDPRVSSATLQRQLVNQTKRRGNLPLRRMPTDERLPDHPSLNWCHTREPSIPSSPAQFGEAPKGELRPVPLKTCLKQKSKSAATTPPFITGDDTEHTTGISPFGSLRRVKTVEFEREANRTLLYLPPLQVWTAEDHSEVDVNPEESELRTTNHTKSRPKTFKRMRSCPGPKTKSSTADPAITKTDVHVIAVAPSLSMDDIPDEDPIETTIPTMQIVESRSGCYEVVWDNVPPEHDIRERRRGSTASLALQNVGSGGAKGLERVNTRLTEWTQGKDSPTDIFKPQIVVFPDSDGRSRNLDPSYDDDEFTIFAPPNTTHPSANQSTHPYRSESVRLSTSSSHDDTNSQHSGDSPMTEKPDSVHSSLVLPDPGAATKRPGYLIGASRGVRKPPQDRRLSNVDESDMKFRGHRDSVTLLRSRMVTSSGISLELFMHRDSVSMAKKRMYARNHAVSSAREIPKKVGLGLEFVAPFGSGTKSAPTTPREEERGMGFGEGMEGERGVARQNNMQQHIRIVE
ncbi:hypothetical protein P154DRAFT_558868 [Amniculicola lignicola CBS 123094]|uniref:Uncharacterized protein n=1 Tax=Amniculicola lignicola CBS 123094 TaxID=1392246 RepID=A0A6A5X1J6_9PLEO|nr:hypothetical protein P154DRAFT_558868 [Amniculicola lignicola CBS 123094]